MIESHQRGHAAVFGSQYVERAARRRGGHDLQADANARQLGVEMASGELLVCSAADQKHFQIESVQLTQRGPIKLLYVDRRNIDNQRLRSDHEGRIHLALANRDAGGVVRGDPQ